MVDIVMPQLGLTMTEGSVTAWLKKPGEKVEKGEPLFTVETDKVEMEVESTATGYLNEVLVEAGQIVPVGTVIARVGDGKVAVGVPALHETAASPRARKLAKELGVDITAVRPSRGHRIVEEDIRRHHAERQHLAVNPQPTPAAREETGRKVIAERLSASFQQAPHFYLGAEVIAAELVRLREKLGSAVLERASVKLTYTDFFLMALARALFEHGDMNASWQAGALVKNATVDVGFAVQGATSLLVPVIRNADRLQLADLAKQRAALADKAREGKLTLAEMEGGGATLSNLGPYGIDWFQAILNPPQSVIVSTGRIASRPAVIEGQMTVCPMLTITASADHRVVDGVAAARFLARIKELLENPYILVF